MFALLLVALVSLPAESVTKAPRKGTDNPFDLLNGYWSGGGTVAPGKGAAEKVSCKVTYNVAGSAVSQNMRCAGTHYKFNTSSKLTYVAARSPAPGANHLRCVGKCERDSGGNAVHSIINCAKSSGRMSINVSGSSRSISIVQLDPNRPQHGRIARPHTGDSPILS